jgi:foldase protein PrsA
VTDQEIDAQIQTIADQQGGQDKLNQILQLQGISQPELRNLVKLQILRQKMFGDQAQVSDDEVNAYFEQNKDSILGAQSNPDASTEAKLKDQVRQQLSQQKINATFSAWLQENLQSNRIVRVQ